MKVSFALAGNDIVRSGYVNIDPLCSPDDPQKIKANIDQLDLYCDDGEVEELIAVDVIDYVPIHEKENIINGWLKKIALNGVITIGGTDLKQVGKAFAFGQLDLQKTNELLYGNQLGKSGVVTVHQMSNLLQSRGYKVIEKKILDFSYIVKAQRVN